MAGRRAARRGARGGEGIPSSRAARARLAAAAAAVAGAGALGAWLALAADSGVLLRANAAAAACAVVALAGGLALRLAAAVPAAVVLLGAEYAALLGFEGEGLDLRAPLVAGALYAVAELAYWSLELRGAVADEAGTYLRRVSLLAGLAVASVALGVGLLTLADSVTTAGPALDAVGAAAAVAALALVALASSRRTRP